MDCLSEERISNYSVKSIFSHAIVIVVVALLIATADFPIFKGSKANAHAIGQSASAVDFAGAN